MTKPITDFRSAYERTKNSFHTSQETSRHRYKAQPVNAVYCENHTEHTDTLRGQNAEIEMLNEMTLTVVNSGCIAEYARVVSE
jgi:spore coat protein CotH